MGKNELKTENHMKTETKPNILLVVFCVLLIGFVLFIRHKPETATRKATTTQIQSDSTQSQSDTDAWIIPYLTTPPQ